MLKELITPINAQVSLSFLNHSFNRFLLQIAEIKQLYEQTREKAEAAAREVAQSKNQQALNEQDVLNLFSKMKDYQVLDLYSLKNISQNQIIIDIKCRP